MVHALVSYLKYIVRSVHLHGIHSPFIFNFQKKCLKQPLDKATRDSIATYRNRLKKDATIIQVTDYGAGSRIFKDANRSVQDILKTNATTAHRAEIISKIAAYFKVQNALELGTSLGTASHALAQKAQHVTTVEASKTIYNFTKKALQGQENITFVNGTFSDFIAGKTDSKPTGLYDLIFIDGHHDGDATIAYFNALVPYSHNDTVFILDDIHWSPDMTRAWQHLQKHPAVTASINSFYWGFLFLRNQQKQEAFYIKL